MSDPGPLPIPPSKVPDARALEALKGARRLRFGVVGLGTMGRTHAQLLRRRGPHLALSAVTSGSASKRAIAEELGCRWFDSASEMFASGEVDAVVIATPHPSHAQLAIDALRTPLHVICEKPLTATISQADAVLEAGQQSPKLLTVVSQTRFEPAYQFIRTLLDSGEFGPIRRCETHETFWRPSAYFRSSGWRGTWQGEGGGVLINQAIHLLDRYLWLCGRPESVTSFCDTLLHPIEVEDTASALFRHGDGAHGIVHVSTAEAPAVCGTVITCDRGEIVFDSGAVRVTRLVGSVAHRTATDPPDSRGIDHETTAHRGPWLHWSNELLGRFYDQFALAAAHSSEVPVPIEDARAAVELANAILLSSAEGLVVNLPLDRSAYDRFLAGHIAAAGEPARRLHEEPQAPTAQLQP